MNARGNCRLLFLSLALVCAALPGCQSSGDGGSQASATMYYGVGLHDPWYYGSVYYPPDVIVAPPPERPAVPPHVEHPIATPPRVSAPAPSPMPSIPSTPRPALRR